MTSKYLQRTLDRWTADPDSIIEGPRPGEAHEALRGQLPDNIFEVWNRIGFSGLYRGRVWLCDPLVWQDAADSWTQRLDLAMDEDRWIPILRSAFGEMRLWGPRTGMSLWIDTIQGMVLPFDNSDLMDDPDDVMESALMGIDENAHEFKDDNDSPMFDRALAKLGPTSTDTMYTFAPLPLLGGELTIDNLILEQATTHVALLSMLSTVEVSGDVAATQRARAAIVDEWLGNQDH